METKKNLLTFKTFKQKRNKTFMLLPAWFDEKVYLTVQDYINNHNKLQACKYLVDVSKEKNTRDTYDLKWSKLEVCDEIEFIGGKPVLSNPIPESLLLGTGVTNDEIKRTLKPFMALANECLRNSSLNKDQVVYAYNHATITMQDLRNVEALMKKLYQ